MKKTKILYWVFTGLFAALMLSSSIPNILSTQESIDLVTGKLGFPQYFIPFLGVAKLLGAIAILVPGYPRIKEWAYAGLTYDLLGATFAIFSVSPFAEGAPMIIFLLLPAASYYFYHKKLKEEKAVDVKRTDFATA